ncbi:hypothetical protein [Streptomyces sp. NPDC059455]|uniref:hypothetical protein n=1 Tax=Streptomyces sp. NPDC059455 TaxID=3346837 RepID=UPI003696C254
MTEPPQLALDPDVPPGRVQRDLENEPWIVHDLTNRKPWLVDYGDDPLGRLWHTTAAELASVLDQAHVAHPAPRRSRDV